MQNTYKALMVKVDCFNKATQQSQMKPPMKVVRLHTYDNKNKQCSQGVVLTLNTYNTLLTIIEVLKVYFKKFDTSLSDHSVNSIIAQVQKDVNSAVKEDNAKDYEISLKVTPTNGLEHDILLNLSPVAAKPPPEVSGYKAV